SSLGAALRRQPDSRGSFTNINLAAAPGIGHFNIEKQQQLQRTIVRHVLRYVSPLSY
ncbi:MAG: hypothetical protein GY761_13540, partial [Hyphomicrobiales bacterium]|nr:hypothetical protein [Hyphomicrobiales bacterium]